MICVFNCYVAHVNEHIATHDTLQNTITTIVLENGAHIQKEISHLYPHHTRRQMDIVITKDDLKILADIVIVDLTCTYLVQHALSTTMHAKTIATQDIHDPTQSEC
jgi:hypothetical protein